MHNFSEQLASVLPAGSQSLYVNSKVDSKIERQRGPWQVSLLAPVVLQSIQPVNTVPISSVCLYCFCEKKQQKTNKPKKHISCISGSSKKKKEEEEAFSWYYCVVTLNQFIYA